MTQSAKPAPAKTKNPYVGPRPFTTKERIYGRDEDCEQLVRLLTSERIVLFHSPSGAGKSSLINAALLAALSRQGYSVQPPLTIGRPAGTPERRSGTVLLGYFSRSGAPAAGGGDRLLVDRLLAGWNAKLEPSQSLPAADLARRTLKEFAAHAFSVQGQPQFPVLIFDQFEDAFTAFPEEPASIRTLFEQLGELLNDRGIWALFAMREDYIGQLEPYRRYIPGEFRGCERLDLLLPEDASEAVWRPAEEAHVHFDEKLAEELVRRLRLTVDEPGLPAHLGTFVEPVLLQVVCTAMWDLLPGDAREIPASILPSEAQIKDAIGNFYGGVLDKVARKNGVDVAPLRAWCGNDLIRNHVRAQVRFGPTKGPADGDILRDLEDLYLIRRETRGEATWYELAHDRLVDAVLDNNRRWRLTLPEDERLLRLAAQEWRDHAYSSHYLLRGRALRDATQWFQANPKRLTPPEVTFLERSRREHRQAYLLNIFVGLFVLFGLLFGWSARQAQRRTREANVSKAENQRIIREKELAVVQAVAAIQKAEQSTIVAEAREVQARKYAQDIVRQARIDLVATRREIAHLQADMVLRQNELDASGRKIASQEAQLKTQGDQLSAGQESLKVQKSATEEQTRIATRSQAAADRLSARAESRMQAAFALGRIGENTRADTLNLIAALRDQVDRHRTLEPDALAGLPVLLQASLNQRTLRYPRPLAGIGSDPETGNLLVASRGSAVLFSMQESGPARVPDEKVFRACLDGGKPRLLVSTSARDARSDCKIISWPTAVAVGPTGNQVLVGFPNGRVFLWDWNTGKSISVPAHRHPIVSLDFSDDNRAAVSASAFWSFGVTSLGNEPRRRYRRPTILEWARITIWGGATELVRSVRFLGGTGLLAVGFEDGRVELWSASRAKRWTSKRLHFSAVSSLDCDASGSKLVSTAREGGVVVWHVEHAAKSYELVNVRSFRPRMESGAEVVSSALDPSGRNLALGLGSGWVEIWDPDTGGSVVQFRAHTGPVNAVRFLGRGLLASTGDDGLLRTWRLLPPDQTSEMRDLVARMEQADLPRDERQLSDDQVRYWEETLDRAESFLRRL